MSVRADHVAGTAFVLFGLLVFLLSRDLPVGSLSFPSSGFLPKLLATLLIAFGGALILRAAESRPFSDINWSDLKHAGLVISITGAAIYSYTWLGFIVTIALLLFCLLVIIERKNFLVAALYSITVALLTYGAFAWGLKTPLPTWSVGF
ncbi:MAG: tripartite tricarboxylate transporter TctB family protein [Xanthobacteraceae bacterium]